MNRNDAAASGTGIFHFLPFHEMLHEHWMVHELRQRRWIGSLSFTAELEDRAVIGHIIYSNAVGQKGESAASRPELRPFKRIVRISASGH